MRTLNRCIPLALAAGLLAALPLDAQDPTQPRTHTVVRGDNLWDLAQKNLGNPFLWPEIYRLNRDVVEDPHWIYPGEILRLPGEGPPTVSQLPDSTQVGGPPNPPPIAAPSQRPVDPSQPTIFARNQGVVSAPVTTGTSIGGVVNDVLMPTVRAGQVITAPFVDREGGPRGFGRILKSGDIAGISEASDRFRFQAFDRVLISPPVGHVAPEGERYLAYKLGPVLDQGQIIIPTGIVEVVKAARTGIAAIAKVVRAFNELSSTDRLIALDTAGVGNTARPSRVPNGPSTKISWVYGEPVLPNVQSFVVLNASSRQGVRMGDEFLVYEPRKKQQEGQLDDPEIPIGKLQVVRSTPYGVTAVILGQEQPLIREGMTVRVTARMP